MKLQVVDELPGIISNTETRRAVLIDKVDKSCIKDGYRFYLKDPKNIRRLEKDLDCSINNLVGIVEFNPGHDVVILVKVKESSIDYYKVTSVTHDGLDY